MQLEKMIKKQPDPEPETNDLFYELPKNIPTLELGDPLLNSLGVEAQSLFDNKTLTKKEEEDELLKDFMEQYNIENIKNTMDESGQIPESIYFFYGGDSDEFVKAINFINASPINREFAAFLMSDLGRKTVTQNKLSIHIESGDIFYDNHNTDENFLNFLLSQQNDEAAFIPKKISFKDSFEAYIGSFLQSFSIDDQEKFDLLALKNSKYLFYRFNDFIKVYRNPRYKLLHTRKMRDSVGLKTIEEKRNKQFLIEKIIHGIEFKNPYATNTENEPEVMCTIEKNYRVARRVYQQSYLDAAELFAEFLRSFNRLDIEDLEADIVANGWALKKISENPDSEEILNIFQEFYSLNERLPLSNSLLVVSDADVPPEEKLNMRQLYDLFKNTNSHGLVSIPFLELIQYYLEDNDQTSTKYAIGELYYNLSYEILFFILFDSISELSAILSILLKHACLGNRHLQEIENENLAKKNKQRKNF